MWVFFSILVWQQPLPFSHKTHAGAGLRCADCHTLAAPGRQAGLPPASRCMACHRTIKAESPHIALLAGYERNKKPVPWRRLYRLADYVFFSHRRHHVGGGIACETCHGPVASRDVLARETDLSMKACMDCHDQTSASNECHVCHDRY